MLLRDLQIDVMLDDFVGYVAIPGCPVRCLVMPEATQQYWHPTGQTGDDAQFGRRVYRPEG